MSEPYLDALEQLDMMRDRAFKAEAQVQRVRELCDTWLSDGAAWAPYSARVILNALDGDGDE